MGSPAPKSLPCSKHAKHGSDPIAIGVGAARWGLQIDCSTAETYNVPVLDIAVLRVLHFIIARLLRLPLGVGPPSCSGRQTCGNTRASDPQSRPDVLERLGYWTSRNYKYRSFGSHFPPVLHFVEEAPGRPCGSIGQWTPRHLVDIVGRIGLVSSTSQSAPSSII